MAAAEEEMGVADSAEVGSEEEGAEKEEAAMAKVEVAMAKEEGAMAMEEEAMVKGEGETGMVEVEREREEGENLGEEETAKVAVAMVEGENGEVVATVKVEGEREGAEEARPQQVGRQVPKARQVDHLDPLHPTIENQTSSSPHH